MSKVPPGSALKASVFVGTQNNGKALNVLTSWPVWRHGSKTIVTWYKLSLKNAFTLLIIITRRSRTGFFMAEAELKLPPNEPPPPSRTRTSMERVGGEYKLCWCHSHSNLPPAGAYLTESGLTYNYLKTQWSVIDWAQPAQTSPCPAQAMRNLGASFVKFNYNYCLTTSPWCMAGRSIREMQSIGNFCFCSRSLDSVIGWCEAVSEWDGIHCWIPFLKRNPWSGEFLIRIGPKLCNIITCEILEWLSFLYPSWNK